MLVQWQLPELFESMLGVFARPARQLQQLRAFQTRAEHKAYLDAVRRSALARPDDARRADEPAKAAPFLHSVDPMASHLQLWTAPRGAAGTAAASMIEAVYPLSTDEPLRHSVRDVGKQGYSPFRLGKFFEAVDALTADVAYAHTDGENQGLALVTASHSHSRKLERTAIARDLSLRCYVTRTGSASLEVRTDAVQVDEAGVEVLVNSCATTMVAVDGATGKPAKGAVPPLGAPDAADASNFELRSELAATHAAIRRRRAGGSMLLRDGRSHPPRPEEMEAVHELEREALRAREAGDRPVKSIGASATFRSSFVVFPEQRNVHGKLFGGFVMEQAFTLASYAARFFAGGAPVVPLGIDDATFNSPVSIGDCVTFTARVVHRTAETCRVNVSVEIRDPAAAHLAPKKSNRAVFVFAARSRTLLVPESYSEVLMHVDAARFSASEGPDDAEVVALLGDSLS